MKEQKSEREYYDDEDGDDVNICCRICMLRGRKSLLLPTLTYGIIGESSIVFFSFIFFVR